MSYSIQYGYNAPAEETGDIRMVRISDIQHGDVLWATVPFCHINESEIDTYLLQKDDILFARTGGTVGKSFLVKDVPYPSIYAGYLIRTRYSNMLSAQYMKYFMECELYWEQLRNGTIATAQPNCNGKTLAKMILPIPPYNEQIRITDKLNQVLEQVRRYGESQDRLDKLNIQIHDLLKKSILQEAIQGRLVAQDASDEPASILLQRIKEEKLRFVAEGKLKKKDVIDSTIFRGDDNKYYEQTGSEITCIDNIVPFDLPASWCWVRHNQLFEVSGGSQPPKSHFIDHYKEGYIRLYQIRDYGSNPVPVYVPKDEISKTTRKGDILLARYGGSLGKVFWAEEGAYNVAMAKVIPLYKSDSIYNEYIFLYYCSSIYQSTIIDHSRSAQAGFNKDDLADMLFPLPPFAEQARIVERYKSIVASIMSR